MIKPNSQMGVYSGKGTYWQFFTVLIAEKLPFQMLQTIIFLLEFEICLYKHLYFLYIRKPLFPIVVFISMLWQLKVNMFYPKNSFPLA